MSKWNGHCTSIKFLPSLRASSPSVDRNLALGIRRIGARTIFESIDRSGHFNKVQVVFIDRHHQTAVSPYQNSFFLTSILTLLAFSL